jgi:hypothetical protein
VTINKQVETSQSAEPGSDIALSSECKNQIRAEEIYREEIKKQLTAKVLHGAFPKPL